MSFLRPERRSGRFCAVSLCLNGKTITFTGDANYRYPVFEVKGASMTVTDCVGDGAIDGNNRSGSVVYVEEGSFTLAGGGITGGRGTIRFDPYTNCAEVDGKEGYGYGEEGFYIQGGGVFALDSDLIITGGAIYGNGVAAADARWYGEDVTKYQREETAPGNGVYEGAIVEGGAHVTYHSGDTVQISRAQGGGVFIGTTYENRDTDLKSTFVMSGGAISNNVSYLHGAGMFVHNVDFEMRGGVIGGERAYVSSYAGSGATISFSSGGNVAQAGLQGLNGTLGGGIYMYRGNERGDGNDIRFSGTAEISYNVAGSGSAFLVTEGSTLDISGSVRIAHNESASGAVASVSDSTFSMSGGVIEENEGTSQLSVSLGDSSASFTMTGGSVSSNTAGVLGTAQSEAGVSGTGAGLYLAAATNTYTASGIDVTLQGAQMSASGVTVANNTASNSAAGVYIGSGAVQAKTVPVVVAGASLTMKDCSVINNTVTGYYNGATAVSLTGGSYAGVYVGGGATKAGEVYYAQKGTLNMTGGSVSGNVGVTSSGVYVAGDAELTDVAADNNSAGMLRGFNVSTGQGNSVSGAGVSVTVNSNVRAEDAQYTFKMTGGSVSGNTATGNGGGIYASGGNNRKLTVELTNVTVSGNAATGYLNASAAMAGSYGGGMYLTYLTATLRGCTVSYNTARQHGGGIYAAYTALTLSDTDIVNNAAGSMGSAEAAGVQGNGGGVYLLGGYSATVDRSQSFAMTGGSVASNSATRGGGLYITGGSDPMSPSSATLTNVALTSNAATGYYNTSAKMAEGEGGGAYVNTAASAPTLTLSGGKAESNSAYGNGGGVYVNGSGVTNYAVLALQGNAAVRSNFAGVGNTAACYGGGVYANRYSHVEVSGTVYVKGNSALKTADGEQTATASNVYLQVSSVADAAKITVGSLSGTACIYLTATKNDTEGYSFFAFADGTSAYDASAYFLYDIAGYKIAYADSALNVAKDEESTGDEAAQPSEDFNPGSQENPATVITVGVSVTDVLGEASSGGVVQGVTSLYYDGENEEALKVGYTVTIREGYYLAYIMFNGAKYYFNSYDGYLYMTTDDSAGSRCEVSPFTYEGGVLTFAVTLDPETVNEFILAVGAIEEPFTVTDTAASYDGSAKDVSVSKNSAASSVSHVSEFASYVSSYTVEYMVGGIWTTESPVDAGVYAVRVVWAASPYVGSSSYGADIWTITIAAQVWGEETENISLILDEDEFVYQDGEFKPGVTVTDTAREKVLAVGVDYEITYSNNKAAGTGVVIVTGIGNYDGSLTVTFLIAKAPNTVTYGGQSEYENVFTGRETTIDLGTVTSVIGEIFYTVKGPDGASVSLASGMARFTFVNAGTYVITFTSEGDTNYASHSVEVTVRVAKAENSIDVSNVVIGSYTYSGNDQYFDLSRVTAYVGLSGLEVEVSGGGSYNSAQKTVTFRDAGTYIITLRIPETANYTLAEQTLTVRVAPQQIVKPSEDETVFVYDGTEKTYTVAPSGYYAVVGGVTSKKEAGSSVILIALTDSKNTCWADGSTDELRYTFTVEKAEPAYTVPADLSATAGDALSSIALPAGWTWDDPAAKTDSKTLAYAATFTPEDTANYKTVSLDIVVKVTEAVIESSGDVSSSVSSSTGFVVEAELQAAEVTSEQEYDFAEEDVKDAVVNSVAGVKNVGVLAVYDISLTSGGQNVTVSQATAGGKITVTLAIPDSAVGESIYIVHMHDGEIVSVLAEDEGYTLRGKNVTFEVDQLSQFVFVREQPAETSVGLIVTFAVLDAALVAVLAFLFVNKRRKQRSAQ